VTAKMAIDFYIGKERVLSVSEPAFGRLSASQSELRRRTGRAIDPYGTTTLAPEYATIWGEALRQLSTRLVNDPDARVACESIVALLERAARDRVTLVIEGE
jgi:hypothetical protein